jgi:hypothetical protein
MLIFCIRAFPFAVPEFEVPEFVFPELVDSDSP